MEDKIIDYKKFFEQESFLSFSQFLKENGIYFETSQEMPNMYHSSASVISTEYYIKIKQSDFEKANNLVNEWSKKEIENIDPEYYLFSFTDEELYEIIMKPDEWSAFDYQLSKKILKDKGKQIDEALVSKIKKTRIDELCKHEDYPKNMILVGYVVSFLGGILGIVIGYMLFFSKKSLPDGSEIYTYDSKARNHGQWILFISILAIILTLILKINKG